MGFRILIVTTVPAMIKAFLLPFINKLQRGNVVGVMCRDTAVLKETIPDVHVFDTSWTRNPLNILQNFAGVKRIAAYVDEMQYDIVHVHSPVAAFLTRLALRKLRRLADGPIVIYTAHGFHFHPNGKWYKNRLFIMLEKWAGKWTDYLVVINRTDEAAAKKYQIVPAEKIRYMPGIGVDTTQLTREKVDATATEKELKIQLGIKSADKLVLMVAEFNPGKRHVDAIRAFAAIRDKNVRLLFAGKGKTEALCKKMVQQLGLQQRIHFLGFRADIPQLMCLSAAVILPSEREGLPRALMEAMCLEVPVLGTNIRGISDLLQEGCGRLFPVGDESAMAREIEWVIDNPDRVREMTAKARRKIEAFDIEVIQAMHEQLYQDAIEAKKRHETPI